MASIIYLVMPELLAEGRQTGVFVDDPKGIAPAWFNGSTTPPAPPGPVYVNRNAK